MAHYKMLDGNAAAVEAMKMARVQVISAYPITPQSSISEKLSELVDSGELNARYIRVESEHSAMSCAIGAQLTGVTLSSEQLAWVKQQPECVNAAVVAFFRRMRPARYDAKTSKKQRSRG